MLVAEGDAWFDYPFNDVLSLLEDSHGYDVESVTTHKGDRVEEMAYGGGQLDALTRRLEKLLRQGTIPRAILLSGGGNDVAGLGFGMLLNHAGSAIAGLNPQVVAGVIDQRVRLAYVTILNAITHVCQARLGRAGADPRPRLRLSGFRTDEDSSGAGGFSRGPGSSPGSARRVSPTWRERVALAKELIDHFTNVQVKDVGVDERLPARDGHVDLRGALSVGSGLPDMVGQ